jgi:hypothetical protein
MAFSTEGTGEVFPSPHNSLDLKWFHLIGKGKGI